MEYIRRVLDEELDAVLAGVSAVAIEGPKAVGKTATATRRARTRYELDDPTQAELVSADPTRLATGDEPILVDEWQRVPASWDVVRRAVDKDPRPSRFLLAGSASPAVPPTHSGAGRIVRLRMRPMSLAERGVETPAVSLRRLLSAEPPKLAGTTEFGLADYAREITRSGFPALRRLRGRAGRSQLDSYVARIIDREFEEAGRSVRKPDTLRRWLAAYAAATGTTATLETIRDAAAGRRGDRPSRPTVRTYREVLKRIWVLEPVPAWLPSHNQLSRLSQPEKHHLADPALAATLLGTGAGALLEGEEGTVAIPRDGTLLGHLFESLVTQSVRVYAQLAEATVKHLRTKGGRHEVDLIVERRDHRVVAIEVKLSRSVSDRDVRHLSWLEERLGDDLLDALVVNTGPNAYRRPDGIGVVPAALLGP